MFISLRVLPDLFPNRFVAAAGGRRSRHSRPRRIDLLGILQRHPGRLPSAGVRDGRQIDVELREILRGPHPRGVPTDFAYKPRWHSNPLQPA